MIMADKIKIGYFLEDRGHEILLKALVARVAKENGLKTGDWIDDVRTATGGKSIQAFETFLINISHKNSPIPFDILVVASDGNCTGYNKKKRQLVNYAGKANFTRDDILVFAAPDPHIERWYMDDPLGFNKAVGSGVLPVIPPYKCEKGFYKKVMRETIASSGVKSQIGGYEYGERIVEEMDLYKAGKADRSLKHFLDDLGDILARIKTKRAR